MASLYRSSSMLWLASSSFTWQRTYNSSPHSGYLCRLHLHIRSTSHNSQKSSSPFAHQVLKYAAEHVGDKWWKDIRRISIIIISVYNLIKLNEKTYANSCTGCGVVTGNLPWAFMKQMSRTKLDTFSVAFNFYSAEIVSWIYCLDLLSIRKNEMPH